MAFPTRSLKDKPNFAGIVEELLEFFGDARWVAHNATFDMGFMNAEFARHRPAGNHQ